MVQEKIILIAKKHDTWVDIVCTFGCTRRIAEDITQEMYIKIQLQLEKGGLDIMYNDEINYYYIFKTLKTLFIDLKRKQKNIQIISLDEHIENFGDTNYGHSDVNFIEAYDRIEEELENMYWYDRKVFEVINSGESIADFSRKSKIKYYALYFTYKKVKNKLKKIAMTLIRNSKQIKQGVDFTGVQNGPIHPTDIDAVLEFDNEALILVEIKRVNNSMATGQKLVLERLCDSWHTKKAIVLFVTHEQYDATKLIHLHECKVFKYYYKGNWHTKKGDTDFNTMLNELGKFWNIKKLKI